MKFVAIATAILPLASALLVEKRSTGLPQVNAVIDLDDLDFLDLDAEPINVLSILHDLLDQGEIDILGADDKDLSKRANVPFLNCGKSRATRCALTSGGVLATCIWAAIAKGKDMKENTKCVAAAAAFGTILPTDCKLCLGF
ncbi:hypothetical protein Slin15195_G044200 [Septoria linicola]|uniref:Uncharacterized protein n=1 Tax=Septoria linicola TaxID=215465 RepID=A0A9Q9AUT8_9PEZI|nr:hypothetical protein Slin14017_G047720 [Septoria linicola]USW51101.1 hypothetical protein Slin15195_G044200 [Septoria linicola]